MVSITRRRVVALAATLALLAQSPGGVSAAPLDPSGLTAQPLTSSGTISSDISKAAHTQDGRVAVIVDLQDAAVAQYTGTIKGYSATNPRSLGRTNIDLGAQATRSYRAYLKGKQDTFVRSLERQVPNARAGERFDLVLNAVSAFVPADRIAAVAALPGVATVRPDMLLQVQTDRSPSFIGATSVWSQLGGQEKAGQGVIVGVLDTGIWPEHPSFSDPDPSGKAYAAPAPAPDGQPRPCDFSGGSHPGDPFTCNNKLIGADRVMSTYDAGLGISDEEFTTARDDDGHGTHTSSTAAGNGGVTASIFGVDRGIVSGIAPRAQVMMYKVCGEQGCFGSDSAAAVEEAIGDGVNVINFSISGGANPYSDEVEQAFADAYEAGIFVAASAGNSGPTADTTDHRGPWVTTVAASTHTRAFVDTVHVTADGGATLDLQGVSLTSGVGPAPVVYAGGDHLCGPVVEGTYTGKIVVCLRGNYGRAEKGYNVAAAGGVGMILFNNSAAVTDQETDNHFLPASHIQFDQGTALLAFLDSHTNVQATISAGVKAEATGDVMASFSSRGGPNQTLGVSKPDITAPGVQILAGNSPEHVAVAGGPQGELFQAIAGTSMASPHIAGAGALLKALHPDWTPGQIKSALMTTARTAGLVEEDGVTPANAFDAGSGRVDLTQAGSPGLTFDVPMAAYDAHANDLWNVNYPSIYHPQMPGLITLQRTAHSVLGGSSTWKLTTTSSADLKISVPKTISVGAGRDVTFSIKLDATAVPMGQTRFGTIVLTQTKGGHAVLHLPVTIVRRQAAVTFSQSCDPTALERLGQTSCSLVVANPAFSDATYRITDTLPSQLKVVKSSVSGGQVVGNTISASGTLPAAEPADVGVASGESAAGGYLPLSLFGIGPIAGVGDDTITNFAVPAFSYAGETWTRLGVSSNGILVVGGGTAADATPANQQLPNATGPNNVLAGFWTDLNPAATGTVRIGTLSDGANEWIVVDYDGVQEFSTAGNTHTFEFWLGVAGDASPGEDISIAYGPNTGAGDQGHATVGAENKDGNRGASWYYNGTGTLPDETTQLVVSTTPGNMSSSTVSFTAQATARLGTWTNCASLTSNSFQGTSVACVSGSIKLH